MESIIEVRRGPWTVEEDLTLINYIAHHGEGRWNSLAHSAGLKRTGKSCRLRWLNYLRPDVRRGNITLEEQLLILELHSRWGNRWSKIAQHLPGRTDNEIKNYWRTRVQKHAKQLKCDVNSKQFKDTMRYLWMPRLIERIQSTSTVKINHPNPFIKDGLVGISSDQENLLPVHHQSCTPESSSAISILESMGTPVSEMTTTDCCYNIEQQDYQYSSMASGYEAMMEQINNNNQPWMDDSSGDHSIWNNIDDMWFLQETN